MNIDLQWLAAQFPDLTNLAPLGQGGQKLVASAVHPRDGNVVLKLIHPGQDAATTQREILAVTNVRCNRVPTIFETGALRTPIGDCVWMREQRVMGDSVRQMLQRGPINFQQILQMGLHILEALVRAEEAQIVHRDVKPDNIMCDGQGDFWLLDFGIARHLTLQSLTATASPFGKWTTGYAPPEQFRNLKTDIDARSDLFALGVTLYECSTGAHPFLMPPATMPDVLHRVEAAPLVPLQLPSPAGPNLRDLIDAMTQKRRDLRPRTAQEAFTWMQEICTQSQI